MTDDSQYGPCPPFFIVSDLSRTLDHYVEALCFTCTFKAPETDPFFAVVARGSAQLMLKEIGEATAPQPYPGRHEWAAWDAHVHVGNPDGLAAEHAGRNVAFRKQLTTNVDNLRGFEIADPDGDVLFFGRPV